jgi:hypothetical protein
MRTAAAFFATVLIAVPAAWHALDANIQTDGPATKPKQSTLEVDGAVVSVDLDRGVLLAGGTLKATLVATADTRKKISLDVRAMEDMGYGEERVENPPLQVGGRKITIEAAPGGGKPVEVAFSLGDRGRRGVARWFDIEVTKAGEKRPANDEGWQQAMARVGAVTWSGNSFPIAIEPPAVIPTDKPFTVGVRVTNTTKKEIPWLEVDLGGTEVSYGGLEGSLYLNSGEDAPYSTTRVEEEISDEPLKPGESRVYHYLVTPRPELDGVKQYTLSAHAHGGNRGALALETFKATPAPETPPAVAITR